MERKANEVKILTKNSVTYSRKYAIHSQYLVKGNGMLFMNYCLFAEFIILPLELHVGRGDGPHRPMERFYLQKRTFASDDRDGRPYQTITD